MGSELMCFELGPLYLFVHCHKMVHFADSHRFSVVGLGCEQFQVDIPFRRRWNPRTARSENIGTPRMGSRSDSEGLFQSKNL